MSGYLGAETITVRTAPLAVDPRQGGQFRDWLNATSRSVLGCAVQPYSAAEDVAGREFTATRLRLFAPPDAGLVATDRVEHAGAAYEIDGEPGLWRDDVGAPDHIEAVLRRLAG